MARPLRIDYPGAWHHVTNREARKQAIFLDDGDRYEFLRLLAIVHERFGIRVNAFTLMGNHYHLLVENPEGELSRAIHYLDSRYAQIFNTRHGYDGPLFKGRFHSTLVDSDGYCLLAATYIHRNPLEANLTTDLAAYPWSSYRWFMHPQRLLPSWLYTDALEIGGIRTPDQLRLATEIPANTDVGDRLAGPEAVVGSERFIHEALAQVDVDHEISGHFETTLPKVSVSRLERMIARELNLGAPISSTGTQGRSDPARLILVGLAQRISRLSLQQIADRYGYATPKSAGNAVSRFRRAMQDERFACEVQRIVTLCGVEGGW